MSARLLALSAVACAGHAAAAERSIDFHIPRQDRQDALIGFAQQAGLSLGFSPGVRCDGLVGLEGPMSVEAALDQLLRGSSCAARRLDARSVAIVSRGPAAPAHREPAPAPVPSAPVRLSEIVITAEKREELLSSSASGLTAISGRELALSGATDVQELSLLAAGVTVTNLGPGRNKVLLRGLSDGPLTGHTQSTVGIYLGEMRLTYNAPDPDLPLIDVDRVEILRGPQGSLYGSGSIAGLLHVVPNAPELGAAYGQAAISGALTAHGAASGDAWLIVNRPIMGDEAALRLVAWSELSGGYIDIPSRGLRNVDRTRRSGLRLAGRWRATDDLELEATLVHQAIATRDAHYAEPAVGALARSTIVAEPHDNDFTALTLTSRWSSRWGRLTSTLSALDHDVGNTYDAALAPPELFVAGARPSAFRDGNEIRAIVAESRLSSDGSGRAQWIVGAFNALGEQALDGELLTSSGPDGYRERRKDRLIEAAVFGELSYDLDKRLTLTAGGRLFASRLRTSSRIAVGTSATAFNGTTNYDGFAPKVRVAYRPMPGMTLYASASEGYRTTGFNTAGPPGQPFSAGPDGPQPARRYGGDELWSFEIGARWRSGDGRLILRSAASQSRWRNVQADLLLPSGLPFTANLGDAVSRTFELEATYHAGPLRIAGNVVTQDSELTRSAGGLAGRAEQALPDAPELMFGLNFAYDIPMTGRWRARLDGGYAYVGRSHLAVFGTSAAEMGDYGDLRFGASLRSDRTQVGLVIENLLNSRGDTLAFGNPFSAPSRSQTTPQRPRTVRLRIERNF